MSNEKYLNAKNQLLSIIDNANAHELKKIFFIMQLIKAGYNENELNYIITGVKKNDLIHISCIELRRLYLNLGGN